MRAGNIYFVSPGGNDGASGSFGSPWCTLLKARDTIKAGDIIYAMNGVSQTADDGSGWSTAFLLRDGGRTGLPKALVAYPGAVVTIGGVNGPTLGVRSTDYSAGTGACPGYWVFAGLVLRGLAAMALAGGSNWRIVGNDISCPFGDGAGACFETNQASNIAFLGNVVHDTGKTDASALYQGVYFSTDSNHVDAGWNRIERVRGCRGIQVHSSPLNSQGTTGFNQYDLSIHDNVIHDTQCDGIVIATVDPSKGKVELYNNIIYNAGQGPNNPEHSGGWSCIFTSGTTNTGSPGGGTVEIFNNTLFNCGSFTHPPYSNARSAVSNGGGNPRLQVRLRNNIIYPAPGAAYVIAFGVRGACSSGNCPGITGFNNLFFGNGAAPAISNLTQSLNRDPQFLDAASHDFRPRPGSPAIGAGVDTGAAFDQEGVNRGSRFDLGALQSPPQSLASAPPRQTSLGSISQH